MILTNHHQVPPAIIKKILAAEESNPYGPEEADVIYFRTTELIGPPRPMTLYKKYADKVFRDATDFLAIQYGTQFHELCEGVSTENLLYETMVSKEFDYNGQRVVVRGTIDELEHKGNMTILTDDKTCLLRNLGYDKPDYDYQLNVYAHMVRDLFDVVPNLVLQIRYFVKDWTPKDLPRALSQAQDDFAIMIPGNKHATKTFETQAEAQEYMMSGQLSAPLMKRNPIIKQRDKSFQRATIKKKIPASSIHYVNVPLKSAEEMDAYIMGRIGDHFETPDRLCTEDERWNGDIRCEHYCQSRTICEFAKSKGF